MLSWHIAGLAVAFSVPAAALLPVSAAAPAAAGPAANALTAAAPAVSEPPAPVPAPAVGELEDTTNQLGFVAAVAAPTPVLLPVSAAVLPAAGPAVNALTAAAPAVNEPPAPVPVPAVDELVEKWRMAECGERARACTPDSTENMTLQPLLTTGRVQLPGDAVLEYEWKSIGGVTHRFLHIVTVLNRIAAASPAEQAWYVINIGTSYKRMGDDAALSMIGCCKYGGFLVEAVTERYLTMKKKWENYGPDLTFFNGIITPSDVEQVFVARDVPKQVDLIKLDIDGYDCSVLERMLHVTHAKVISMEINHFVPPPTKFAYVWIGVRLRCLCITRN